MRVKSVLKNDFNLFSLTTVDCLKAVVIVDILVSFLISGEKLALFYHWYIYCRFKKDILYQLRLFLLMLV